MKRIVVIGSTRFAVDCLKIIAKSSLADPRLVISDPKYNTIANLVERFCTEQGVPYLETTKMNSDEAVSAVKEAAPDLMVSAFNMRILKPKLLSIPAEGTINFHNGPLPRYRGVNIYSWAIINGEKQHGVTWHYVDEGIDSGDILGQRLFDLASNETPFTLTRKCIQAGVALFGEILDPLLAGQIEPVKQDHAQATYYSLKDTPNNGRIDLAWPFERIERLVRGLDLRPLENTFVYPALSHRGVAFHPRKVTLMPDAPRYHEPGRVEGLEEDVLRIRIGDGVIGMTDLLDAQLEAVSVLDLARRLSLSVDDRLE